MIALLTLPCIGCAGVGVGCSDGVVDAGPAPPPLLHRDELVVFAAVGDTGKDDVHQRRVAAAMGEVCAAASCDFVLLLGDNLYPAGMERPDDPRADRVIAGPYTSIAPVYAVLGNHDWGSAEAAQWQVEWAARGGIRMPSPAWSFEVGPLFLAGVDTTAVFQGDAAFQAGWLKDQLAGSNAVWKVVAGHHPVRSNGPHGNAGAYEGWRWVPWMSGMSLATFFDDAVCGRADLYLAGHDHTRQVLAHCGVRLVVAGSGASATRVVDRGNQVDFADAERGFALFRLGVDRGEVQLYGETGSLDATFALAVPSGRAQNAPEGPP